MAPLELATVPDVLLSPAADDADASAEESEAGSVLVMVLLADPVAAVEPEPVDDAEAVAVEAHVAAVGRSVTPWPSQRASANLMVAITQKHSTGQRPILSCCLQLGVTGNPSRG